MISGRKLKSSPKMLPNWLGPSTTTSTAPSAAPMGTPFSRRISSTVALSSMREASGSCWVRRWTVRLVTARDDAFDLALLGGVDDLGDGDVAGGRRWAEEHDHDEHDGDEDDQVDEGVTHPA